MSGGDGGVGLEDMTGGSVVVSLVAEDFAAAAAVPAVDEKDGLGEKNAEGPFVEEVEEGQKSEIADRRTLVRALDRRAAVSILDAEHVDGTVVSPLWRGAEEQSHGTESAV